MDYTKLILFDGQPQFGFFTKPVEIINYDQFDYRDYLDKPVGKLGKHFAAYQHHFVSFICDDIIVGCAIADAKSAGKGFLYIYDPKNRKEEHFSYLQLFARNTEIDPRPNNGVSSFSKSANKMTMEISPAPKQRKLIVSLPGALSIEAVIKEPDDYEPMILCSRNGYRGWVYTEKATALPVTGVLKWRGMEINLETVGALGSYDWSYGCSPGETTWNWGMFSGKTPDGKLVGLNICAGMNETGFTENCFWVNGKLHKTDLMNFRFNRLNRAAPWEMESFDKKVKLRFEPLGEHGEKVNFVVSKVNFHQMFGRYYGELRPDDNDAIEIDGIYGLSEDHLATR